MKIKKLNEGIVNIKASNIEDDINGNLSGLIDVNGKKSRFYYDLDSGEVEFENDLDLTPDEQKAVNKEMSSLYYTFSDDPFGDEEFKSDTAYDDDNYLGLDEEYFDVELNDLKIEDEDFIPKSVKYNYDDDSIYIVMDKNGVEAAIDSYYASYDHKISAKVDNIKISLEYISNNLPEVYIDKYEIKKSNPNSMEKIYNLLGYKNGLFSGDSIIDYITERFFNVNRYKKDGKDIYGSVSFDDFLEYFYIDGLKSELGDGEELTGRLVAYNIENSAVEEDIIKLVNNSDYNFEGNNIKDDIMNVEHYNGPSQIIAYGYGNGIQVYLHIDEETIKRIKKHIIEYESNFIESYNRKRKYKKGNKGLKESYIDPVIKDDDYYDYEEPNEILYPSKYNFDLITDGKVYEDSQPGLETVGEVLYDIYYTFEPKDIPHNISMYGYVTKFKGGKFGSVYAELTEEGLKEVRRLDLTNDSVDRLLAAAKDIIIEDATPIFKKWENSIRENQNKKSSKIEVGDKVTVLKKVPYHGGDWGVVKYIDEDGNYHVAMFGGDSTMPIFDKTEVRLYKKANENLNEERNFKTYSNKIRSLSHILDTKEIPHETQDTRSGGQIIFDFCEGDVLCDDTTSGMFETYRFPWDKGDFSRFHNAQEVADLIEEYYDDIEEYYNGPYKKYKRNYYFD